jgi:hypothetical protein
LKPTCELCGGRELSILGATSKQVAIGEGCYGNLLLKGARWTVETTKAELLEMARGSEGP